MHSFFSFFRKSEEIPSEKRVTENLLAYSHKIIPEIFMELETDEKGLVGCDVKTRLEKYGLNQVSYERPPTWYQLLLRSYLNPFNILLSVLGLLSYFLEDLDGTLIILVMVLLSVGIRFIQELRSHIAAEKLKALVSTKATVIRRGDSGSAGTKIEVPMEDIVPGDIIFLSAGDMLPADVRLISSKELFVSQSSLTGESMPVEKYDLPLQKDTQGTNLIEMPNMCFYGTNVLNGTALAVVIATGNHTFFGALAKKIAGRRPLTSFDIGINKVSWLLIRFMLVMVPIVLLLNGFTKGNWFEAFLFALSVAVGLIPEMLPMIVTANLAGGAVKMARSKVVVKRLNSIQNFGAMNILCTDKTGTLTQDRIILEKHLNLEGEDNEEVLLYGYLNSYYQTGLKNLLDLAVLEHTEIKQQINLGPQFAKVDEIPFDFVRRRMSVVVQKSPEHQLLICKGAVEEVLSVSSFARSNGDVIPMTDQIKQQALKLVDELNGDGLRVLGVAYKEIPIEGTAKEYKAKDENSLILMGFLAFLDPPKQSCEEAIAELQKLGIQVKVLTGDNEIVTRKICKWVGLDVDKVLNGPEMENLSDGELRRAVDGTTIFAKLSPLQKSRVISMLKLNGHTVGYLGDGINDAPALKEADIGISVDTAVDIAKESADIIMLEKSLLFLKEGVVEGRRTFGNIIKYIKMAVSSNFGNVFSVLGASALFPFLPMMPLQLLFQNLLYDMSQITIPFDNVDSEFLKKPRKWDPSGIATFMIFIGPISSIFDYTTFAVLWYVFEANSVENQALFQSGWFVEGLLSQTLIVHMIRTQKIPFIQSIASWPLLATTIMIMAIGISIPYTSIGASLGFVPLPGDFYYWLAGTLVSYCLLVQAIKMWFIRKFKFWL
jgi:P-type Mg2+ transporter